MTRLVLICTAGLLALSLAWLLPRLQQPMTPQSVAINLIEDGRASEAVHLLDDRVWRGVAEYRAARYRRAAIEFVQDEDIMALYNLGTSYARLGEWRAARAALERALKLEPDHEDALHNLALVLQAERREQEEAEKERQTRTLGKKEGEPGEGQGTGEGKKHEDQEAQPSDQAAPTEKDPDRGGQISAAGREGNEAKFQDQATGKGTLSEADEKGEADRTGAAAATILRKSMRDTEVILRTIHDDPARVLRARLHAIHKKRQEAIR